MSTGATFLALLKARLPAVVVDGWEGRGGEETYRAIARVFETLRDRTAAELAAARILVATFAAKATGAITITWDNPTTTAYQVSAGQVIARTAWGVEFVLMQAITRTAAQAAGEVVRTVEARWAGFEANIDADLVLDWAIADAANVDSLTWSGGTLLAGKTEFLAGVVDESIRITASSAMTGGRMGTLDLLAAGQGVPAAEGESAARLRRRLRSFPDAITPAGILAAVDKLLVTGGAVLWEYFDAGGGGFAFGVSGFGDDPFSRGLRSAVVVIPNGGDVASAQALVDRIRPLGVYVLILEAA